MSELQKIEYIHFALQEAQNYYSQIEDDLNPEIEEALAFVEDLREKFNEIVENFPALLED